MNLKDLFDICIAVCDKHLDRSEKACVIYKGDKIPYTKLKEEIETVKDWCYPMEVSDLHRCICCENCAYYQSYSRTSKGKVQTEMRCSFDNLPKPPKHYCSFAEEK